jgi:hypothetical protein
MVRTEQAPNRALTVEIGLLFRALNGRRHEPMARCRFGDDLHATLKDVHLMTSKR